MSSEKSVEAKPKAESKPASSGYVAAVRIRGKIHLNYGIKKTLDNLNLYRQNWCVVLKNTPNNVGMLKKVKDYVTWGEVDGEIVNTLYDKKGEPFVGRVSDPENKLVSKKYVEHKGKKYKRYFRLNPPVGGYERKGIKVSYQSGGVLGYRGNDMGALINKMI